MISDTEFLLPVPGLGWEGDRSIHTAEAISYGRDCMPKVII